MDIEPINVEAVSAWLVEELGQEPPFEFSLVESGQSNLTFIVRDSAQNQTVLRRPPLHQVLATAHDMVREHTIISALHPTGFPVPRPLALCKDGTICELPFYMMEFMDGTIISGLEDAKAVPQEMREKAGPALAETLAHLHSIDPDQIGLGELAKKSDYIARQLNRWLKQYKQSKAPQSEEVEKIHATLSANIPEQRYTGIVHADYRLDNCVLDPDTSQVKAVLDWELCTLGDTMADMGVFAAYWAEEGDGDLMLPNSPTSQPGFISRQELLGVYAKVSGRDLDNIEYYLAFSYWRVICILQGVYSRYLDGAMHGKTPLGGMDLLKSRIKTMIQKAQEYVGRIVK